MNTENQPDAILRDKLNEEALNTKANENSENLVSGTTISKKDSLSIDSADESRKCPFSFSNLISKVNQIENNKNQVVLRNLLDDTIFVDRLFPKSKTVIY